jgi:3-hydroxymyristoyl/3-hydroxydecanoyl-(acyl carrier protein) dehydratase
VLDEHVDEDSIEQLCVVPEDLSCLPDHFPGLPIVPGVMQVDWALDLAATLFGGTLDVREIGALKFRAPLGPGGQFRMKVERTGRETISFRVWDERHEFASGRARIASPGGTSS